MFCIHYIVKLSMEVISLLSPITAPNPMYDVVVKCSNDPITADNPVYGARIDVTT